MTVLTAYLIDRKTGLAGGLKGAESNLLPRPAIAAWAREAVGGWWHLKKEGTEFYGHQLWVLWRAETETMVETRWKVITTMRRSKLHAPVEVGGEHFQVDDRASAESLVAAINASPTIPAVATVHEGRVIIASTPARVGARDLVFSEPGEPGSLFGINASSYENWKNGKALTWKSDLVFNEIRLEMKAPGATAVFRAVTRTIGQSYERPVVLSTPRQPKFRPDTKSRVPRHVQQQQFGRRLDGRRR